MAKTIRVYKSGGEWVAKRAGAGKGRYFDTQKEAYLYAREVALNNGLTITVYYPTGGIQKVITPKENANDDGCFITTACVKYYGFDDNCYQLQTLRNFRDNYLLSDKKNKPLVQQYYSLAPKIVKLLNKSPERDILYRKIFGNINSACYLIDQKKYKEAKSLYIKVVSRLAKYFRIA